MQQRIRIVVDERERSSDIPDLLRQAGATIDFVQLKVGDYIVSPETAVERKTINDLVSSIYDGRLFVQCGDLVSHYQKPLVVIEGNIAELAELPENTSEQRPEKREMGRERERERERMPIALDALATVALEFRIPVLHTPSAEYTAQLLAILVNKSLREGKATGPLLKKIRKVNPVYILSLIHI